jgi:hypothetical protein
MAINAVSSDSHDVCKVWVKNAEFVDVTAGGLYLGTTEVHTVNREKSRGNKMDKTVRNKIGLLLLLPHFVEQFLMFSVAARLASRLGKSS